MLEATEFHRMAGGVDYMLRVAVSGVAAYDAFYKIIINTFALKNVGTRFAIKRIKLTAAHQISTATP